MPAHKSRWTEEYGPVHKVTYRLPERVKDIIEAAATELGITATDAVIQAVLQTYTDRKRTRPE
jgi:uncharacterized protein (DUF1778 family)